MRNFLPIAFLVLCLASCNANKKENCIIESKINKDAMCTQEYNPVCGCNGKTYGNACQAENAGLKSWKPGECPN